MSIDAKTVKELRDKTGAGIVDCKKALEESDGDVSVAAELLRKKGILNASKKSSRDTNEGLSGVCITNGNIYCLQLNCETDFVSRGEKFASLINSILNSAANSNAKTNDDFLNSADVNGNSVSNLIAENIAVIGENMQIGSAFSKKCDNVVYYTHNKSEFADNIGKIIAVMDFSCDKPDECKDLVHKIAMHVAAMSPLALDETQIDGVLIAKEREIFIEQMADSGKPQEVIQKIVDGKMNKFFQENTLLNQFFVLDNKVLIKDVISDFNKKNNTNLKINAFYRI